MLDEEEDADDDVVVDATSPCSMLLGVNLAATCAPNSFALTAASLSEDLTLSIMPDDEDEDEEAGATHAGATHADDVVVVDWGSTTSKGTAPCCKG